MDLLLYEHRPLQTAALKLLVEHHSRRRIFLSVLSDIHLVTDAGQIALLHKIRSALRTINDLADRHELWDAGDIETCIKHLRLLSAFCDHRRKRGANGGESKDDAASPGARVSVRLCQRLLRNCSCADVILKLLRLPYKPVGFLQSTSSD